MAPAPRPTPPRVSGRLTCVEVGGGSIQSILFDGARTHIRDGAYAAADAPLLIASPGLIRGRRVLAASNLQWFDVDPAEELGLDAPVDLLLNDAHAAALGEFALRGARTGLTFVGLGTGVGAAVVSHSEGNSTGIASKAELGHITGFSSMPCACGRTGCLETVAAGWALPDPLSSGDEASLIEALAAGLRSFIPSPTEPSLIVLGGGLARRYPSLVQSLATALPGQRIEPSAAPTGAKSASAWGLRYAFEHSMTSDQAIPEDLDIVDGSKATLQ